MTTIRIAAICSLALLAIIPVASRATSFNCAKATSANEVTICSDRELSAIDDHLAVLFRAARAVAPDAAAFKKETNYEWRKRQQCPDRDCLLAWYQRRSSQLEKVLNSTRTKETPVTPVSPPVPAEAATPAASDSSMGAGVLLYIGVVLFLMWAAKLAGGRNKRRAAAARGEATSHPIANNRVQSKPAIPVSVSWNDALERLSPKKRSAPVVPTVWISAGQPTVIETLHIPGGMFYVGSTLTAPDGSIEPAQIDPTLDVDSRAADPAERLFGYWPRYDQISPQARRTYLTWLAGGRQDPNADVGYVFLFFYGLERRVLVDARTDAAAKAEVPAILAEVERLRATYANHSFQRYTQDFLEYVTVLGALGKALYSKEPPPPNPNGGMPLLLRVGLGQCALDGFPVPPAWALAWARSEPNVSLPRLAGRCQTLFDEQFKQKYSEQFAGGLKLSVNRTKLKVSYRPASAGLLSRSFTTDFGDLPDVTTVVTPLKKLQGVIDEAAEDLKAYSRFIGRHADKVESLEATMLLPKGLWGSAIKQAVTALDVRVGTGMCVVRLGELLSAFGGTTTPTRETLKNLFGVLRSQSIGVEPDVLSGAKTPRADDSVVLFRLAGNEGETGSSAASAYAAVAVMLDLAIALANAEGEISGREVQFLNRQVDTWSHVGELAQRRLRARLRLGILYPPTMASLKSRIEPLPTAARNGLAKLLASLAMADGKLDSAEVRQLEKVYALLGIDRTVLYTELHGVAAESDRGKASLTTPTPSSGTQLDPTRIAALQAESERVTALLSKVFEEESPASPPVMVREEAEESPAGASRLLGLDGEHSAFLRVLLTRRSWSRAELQDIASDMEIMLDGALERVNEAALEKFDAPLAEGDDPIEVSHDLMENVSA